MCGVASEHVRSPCSEQQWLEQQTALQQSRPATAAAWPDEQRPWPSSTCAASPGLRGPHTVPVCNSPSVTCSTMYACSPGPSSLHCAGPICQPCWRETAEACMHAHHGTSRNSANCFCAKACLCMHKCQNAHSVSLSKTTLQLCMMTFTCTNLKGDLLVPS